MHAGRNIATIGALRGDFRLSFFDAALMADPEGILEKQGPNTRYPDMIRFRENNRPNAIGSIIRAYLAEAMRYADEGIRPPKEARDDELPDELTEALEADPELAEAFFALTPGRQRSYVIDLQSAKRPETRISRIERFRHSILAGRGAQER
jgi:uncharacterized protein YdeI (YjbR/CyaY-like superfamily)